ncbi:MAG: CoA-binding protein [Deltaproteobacteria bacterium]|nr:CoA-binding protein [Deltaproteobacteria bacterium]
MNEIRCELPDLVPPPEEIVRILRSFKKIAVVGLSPKEKRDSHRVAGYLLQHGYEVIPVNPGQKEILGRTCYRSLKEIPFEVEVVDLFLNPARVPPVVDQAIEIGAKVVWMQLGVVHNEAARKAREAGIAVVMNRCIKQEHEKMRGRG